MTKRIGYSVKLNKIIIALMVLTLALTFASCKNDSSDDNDNSSNTTKTYPTELVGTWISEAKDDYGVKLILKADGALSVMRKGAPLENSTDWALQDDYNKWYVKNNGIWFCVSASDEVAIGYGMYVIEGNTLTISESCYGFTKFTKQQ